MDKLLKARQRLSANSKKGFTLVELIVVIVILAILVAALTPAILGVISRANRSADEADVRSILMAAQVAALDETPPSQPDEARVLKQLVGGNVLPGLHVNLYFDGPMAVSAVAVGSTTRSGDTDITVGRANPTGSTVLVRIAASATS